MCHPQAVDLGQFLQLTAGFVQPPRPLTQTDERNLKRLCLRPELQDVRPVIEHLLKRGVKLEQEAIRL